MRPEYQSPKVGIILVNWNGLTDTQECLTSLSQITYPHSFVVVVDNGSQNAEAAAIQVSHPSVTVLEAGANLGFTGGNNFGIKYALNNGADYLLCLNNDTIVAPDFLDHLVTSLEQYPDAGIATSTVFYADDPERVSTQGNWVVLSAAAPSGHINDEHLSESAQFKWISEEVAEVPAVSGCVLLMRRIVAEATRGFDDQFFAYMEDIDLCLRAHKAGWKCLAVPASRVWHKIGSTTGGEDSPTATHYYTRNCCRLVSRHGSQVEKKLFFRRFRENISRALEGYLLAGSKNPLVWHDLRRRESVVSVVVNVWAGLLGLSGDRKSYRMTEAIMRTAARGYVASAVLLERYICSHYDRLYWKANALSPVIAGLLPGQSSRAQRRSLLASQIL